MDTYDTTMAPHLRTALVRRAASLRETLGHETDAARSGTEAAGDFKDAAARAALADVEDIQAGQAAQELGQVNAALRRIDDGSYGRCLDCGDPIALRRLLVMPAAAYCTDCQAMHDA